jgi:hypothetical protein
VKIAGPMGGFRGRAKITRKITRHSPLVTLTCHLDKGCCLVKAPAGRQYYGPTARLTRAFNCSMPRFCSARSRCSILSKRPAIPSNRPSTLVLSSLLAIVRWLISATSSIMYMGFSLCLQA